MSEVLIEVAITFALGLAWFGAHDVLEWAKARGDAEDGDDIEDRARLAFRAVDRHLKKHRKRIKSLEREVAELRALVEERGET